MANRCSSLPISQFCGQAPKLSALAGAGRMAIMGRAFHGRCAGSPDWRVLWERLTKEEQAEVDTWRSPTLCWLKGAGEDGRDVALNYDYATKEFPLGLLEDGSYCAKDDPRAVTHGTCDMFWIVPTKWGRIAYVPDIKRSEWTVADGPESLQILAYAYAIMSKFDCVGFCAGIWAAKEGTWWWGPVLTWDEHPEELLLILRRIVAAGRNDDPDHAMGSHCRSCYGRTHCPAWLPTGTQVEELAPFAVPGAIVSSEDALRLLILKQRAEDLAERATKLLKEHAAKHPVLNEDGTKKWARVEMQGREAFDRRGAEGNVAREILEAVDAHKSMTDEELDPDRLLKLGKDVVSKYYKRGASFEQFRWINTR